MQIKQYQPTNSWLKAVVYGPSGVGKTVFGSTAPDPIFASAENGLLSIADKAPAFVEIRSLQDLREMLRYLQTEKHPYKTVVIDSITEVNEVIKEGIRKTTGRAMQQADWGKLSEDIIAVIRSLVALPMHVVIIAQEHMEKDDQVVTQIVPDLNGKAAVKICYMMDIVAYLSIDKDGTRRITTTTQPRMPTKARRLQIDPSDLDFSAWVVKMAEVSTVKDQTVLADYTAPKETGKPKQPGKNPRMDQDTLTNLQRTWKQYWDILCERKGPKGTRESDSKGRFIYTPERGEATKKVTIKNIYAVENGTDGMTTAQGADFIARLETKIDDLTNPPKTTEQPAAPENSGVQVTVGEDVKTGEEKKEEPAAEESRTAAGEVFGASEKEASKKEEVDGASA